MAVLLLVWQPLSQPTSPSHLEEVCSEASQLLFGGRGRRDPVNPDMSPGVSLWPCRGVQGDYDSIISPILPL